MPSNRHDIYRGRERVAIISRRRRSHRPRLQTTMASVASWVPATHSRLTIDPQSRKGGRAGWPGAFTGCCGRRRRVRDATGFLGALRGRLLLHGAGLAHQGISTTGTGGLSLFTYTPGARCRSQRRESSFRRQPVLVTFAKNGAPQVAHKASNRTRSMHMPDCVMYSDVASLRRKTCQPI